MNGHDFHLAGACLTALPSGGLWWADRRLLVVSDLHLGKSERMARRGGALLPPYEVDATLEKLDADLAAHRPETVVCLGDSFDDAEASRQITGRYRDWLTRMMAGRRWIWVEGNHDPGPVDMGGTHLAELRLGPLTFRHIAVPGATGEVSGHYHPKVRIAGRARACLLVDRDRAILPAYGTYTGGLEATSAPLADLLMADALALLSGPSVVPVPLAQLPRRASTAFR